eukprot:TRINITY_DN932_c0_g1_i2.p1 TRINITY_DN932_c0_g1~~TRINITY_DN932_c0_g1_i2.p1  ORF type:complete len:268 (-),score=28.89 TRINITY_DN932_c0_g1_i2:225-947(-)
MRDKHGTAQHEVKARLGAILQDAGVHVVDPNDRKAVEEASQANADLPDPGPWTVRLAVILLHVPPALFYCYKNDWDLVALPRAFYLLFLECLITITLYLGASLADPGFLKTSRERPPPTLKNRWCSTCCIDQPVRSKHCAKCDRCVSRYDHHCFLLGQCVGQRNHFPFLLYLLSESWLIIHASIHLLEYYRGTEALYWLDTNFGTVFFQCYVLIGTFTPLCASIRHPSFITLLPRDASLP